MIILICDHYRHFVCYPYTTHNLHIAANEAGINRCWYKSSGILPHPHYDIPLGMVKQVKQKCLVLSKRELTNFVHRGTLPPSLLKLIYPVSET